MICPKCDAKLKLRKGKYGEFYGCSNYPKCKFMLSYNEE
ncbi:MAG: topoisomerase DNA-binding C4 zinc finger domain-containing protein [Treponemataceae bacterium]